MKTKRIYGPYAPVQFVIAGVLLCSFLIPVVHAGDIFTSPKKAKKNSMSFRVQGEYSGHIDGVDENSSEGLQLLHVRGSTYVGFFFMNGLSETKPEQIQFLGREELESGLLTFHTSYGTFTWEHKTITVTDKKGKQTGTLKKVIRTSPTLGKSPPDNAVHLFDGTKASLRNWRDGERTSSGLLRQGTHTKETFQDFTLHLEFRIPYEVDAAVSGGNRGNSGVYLFNNYEVQLLDSFGLHYMHFGDGSWKQHFRKHFGFKPRSHRSRWCGALYKFRHPRVNVSYPPLSWQTYDITFRAPRFENGEKTEAARITVRHNGVLIHENVKLGSGTGMGRNRDERPRGKIYLQAHDNPLRFKNIWIVPENK